jgi:hypothetical protein
VLDCPVGCSRARGKRGGNKKSLQINLIAVEVYIIIIPGFGIISTTISVSSSKSIFGYIGISYFKHCCYNYFSRTSCFKTKSPRACIRTSNFDDFYSSHKIIDPY